MTNKEIIEALSSDVKRLMKQHTAALEHIAALEKENADLISKNRDLNERAKQDKAEIARLQLLEAMSGNAASNATARAQVNRLLREIDKCIAIVSNEL